MVLRLGFNKWVGFQWVAMPESPIHKEPAQGENMVNVRAKGKEGPPRGNRADGPKPCLKMSQPLASQGE